MSPSPEPQPEPSPPGRRRGRGVALWSIWAASVAACGLALLGGAAWWAWAHPGQAARLGIGLAQLPGEVRVGEVDLGTPGEVVLRQVEIDGGRLEVLRLTYSGDGLGALAEGRVERLEIDGGALLVDDALIARWAGGGEVVREGVDPAPGGRSGAAGSGAAGGAPEWLERLVPAEIVVRDFAVAADLKGVPKVSTRLGSLVVRGVGEMLFAGGPAEAEVDLAGGAYLVRGAAALEPVRFGSARATVAAAPGLGRIEVRGAQIDGLQMDLSREGLAEFLDAPPAEGGGGEIPEIAIASLTINDAKFGLRRLEQLYNIEIAAEVDTELRDLTFADGSLRSARDQALVLRDLEVAAPGAGRTPLLRVEKVEVAAQPEALLERTELSRLRLVGLQVDVSKTSLGDFLGEGGKLAPELAGDGGGGAGPVAGAGAAARAAVVVRDLRVERGSLAFDPAGWAGLEGIPAGVAQLEVRTEGEAEGGDVRYGLELTEVEVRETAGASKAFASGASVRADFRALGLQRDGLIDRVGLRGVRAEVGEAVARLAERATAAAGGAAAPSEVEAPEADGAATDGGGPAGAAGGDGAGDSALIVAELEIEDTVIALRDLVPTALPYLAISLNTELKDVPLIGRSRSDETEQRIELKGIRLASPYSTLQDVAELKTVWIYFTISGLFRNEISRIEIVSPDLYVGQPLFWYIDYARKYAAGEPLPGEPVAAGPEGETGEPGEGGAEPDEFVEGLRSFDLAGWKVGSVEANAGRIIIAPKGSPIGIVPFPFSAKTDFKEGAIALDVKVPKGDYAFEELELEFLDMEGQAFVNYPVPTEDNNFVQTFKAPRVKYQQFDAAEVWLSVTYDRNGVYGKLGGEAYGGYVEGGFNLYIEEPYRWEVWLSGTGFDLGPFTDVLAPSQFRMDGVVDGKLVAEGHEMHIDSAEAELATRGGGTMHVIKLDDLKEALPAEWEPVWRAVAEAGIDAFRDYPFASGEAVANYEGDIAKLHVLFDGDAGKRELDLRLFDRRAPAE